MRRDTHLSFVSCHCQCPWKIYQDGLPLLSDYFLFFHSQMPFFPTSKSHFKSLYRWQFLIFYRWFFARISSFIVPHVVVLVDAGENKQLPFTPSTRKIDGCLLIFYYSGSRASPFFLPLSQPWATCKLVLTIFWRNRWSVSKQRQCKYRRRMHNTRHMHIKIIAHHFGRVYKLFRFDSSTIHGNLQRRPNIAALDDDDDEWNTELWLDKVKFETQKRNRRRGENLFNLHHFSGFFAC